MKIVFLILTLFILFGKFPRKISNQFFIEKILYENHPDYNKATFNKLSSINLTSLVHIIWLGSNKVILKFNEIQIPIDPFDSRFVELRTDTDLTLCVLDENRTYFAKNKLKIHPSGGILLVDTSGTNAIFHYETPYQQLQRRVQYEKLVTEFEDKMIQISGGSFTMGCTLDQGNGCGNYEMPAHKVTINSFKLSKFEVTQQQWRLIMGNNPSYFKGCDSCPVENVNWDDVQDFLVKLNKKTGKSYRLPTEAEWEYAARGGNQSLGYLYSGSNKLDSVAWHAGNAQRTQKVGKKKPNELGLYDMTGNVWEWCSDWFGKDYYTISPVNNPKGPAYGEDRVIRGGFGILSKGFGVAHRSWGSHNDREQFFGFRLAHD